MHNQTFKNLVFGFLIANICIMGVTADGGMKELSVFAAASLSGVLDELKDEFEAENPGVLITIHTGNAGMLENQIREGMNADLFLPAGEIYIDRLITDGFIKKGDVYRYTANHLAIMVPRSNQAGVNSLIDLGDPGIRVVTTVRQSPNRGYVDEMLERTKSFPEYGPNFEERYASNIIAEVPSVLGLLTSLALDEADAAIGFQSDISGTMHEKVNLVSIPDELRVTAVYSAGILASSDQTLLANRFIEFLLSAKGQGLFRKYGFIPFTDGE